jgi:hypothetical protein
MSKQSIPILTLVLVVGGCTGSVRSPNETVATFSLYADELEALLVKECVDMYGVQGCTPYPNALECVSMNIHVKADGRTYFECNDTSGVAHQGFAGVGGGVPFICAATPDLICQKCVDVYGNTVLDTCTRSTQVFRKVGSGWGIGEEAAYLEEGSSTVQDTPDLIEPPPEQSTGQEPEPAPGEPAPGEPAPGEPAPGEPAPGEPEGLPPDQQGACLPSKGIKLFAKELNKLLAHEGYNVVWKPDLDKFGDPNKGVFDGKQTCEQFMSKKKAVYHECADVKNGQCYYCYKKYWGFGPETCRCTRIGVAAMKQACSSIPSECDHKAWSTAMIKAYGISMKWLFSPSYDTFYGQVKTSGKFPKCNGSPLVLDLNGDGIRPTSPRQGVTFDLVTVGPLQTSWVRGDDALVALDRNGNGRIDDGTELFGEVTGGMPRSNGFGALAELDSPDIGGNENGRIDPGDRMFGRLLIWQDHDGDGVSHASELSPLTGAGIQSLDLASTIVPDAVDLFGNDLRMQGSFTRSDGSTGLMVDVLFVTGSQPQ